ncbi:excinuclease Cho [Serratia sp. M24T3]|uniref:excinuclease Cho n=1 Tax=Serratia sp. M24T3 TaxID=932213 RepID=UPI00025BAB03|nr:excinuclease Cho [Serratia sp. M24T3]EIC82111.1 nucleotide excision repair endonuclease [Serratia sp. M24T3]
MPNENTSLLYQYPEHLRYTLDTLPTSCGVYVFYGQDNTFPLYIGKSVNIRSRVQSHFRTAGEAKLLRMTSSIAFFETVGEIGALLLESKMIKDQRPLFNKRLRITRKLCSLRVTAGETHIIFSNETDFSIAENLYGLFKTKFAAIEKLREIADEKCLCYGALGLEKLSANRACFRFSLGRCAGVCCGKESLDVHQLRLKEALEAIKIRNWPYPGRIAIEEKNGSQSDFHVLNNWFYLGTVKTLAAVKDLQISPPHFDRDSYKILCQYVFKNKLPIVLID